MTVIFFGLAVCAHVYCTYRIHVAFILYTAVKLN